LPSPNCSLYSPILFSSLLFSSLLFSSLLFSSLLFFLFPSLLSSSPLSFLSSLFSLLSSLSSLLSPLLSSPLLSSPLLSSPLLSPRRNLLSLLRGAHYNIIFQRCLYFLLNYTYCRGMFIRVSPPGNVASVTPVSLAMLVIVYL
jgi:hypothetical protein